MPKVGKHITAQYNESSILVYQAFNDSIADYALENQRFGGENFSLTRMTWIKPNFTWMMYRSGWAQKKNQNRILGIWLKLDAFHDLLSLAISTSTKSKGMKTKDECKVNVQWDPDHYVTGEKLERRAIQIGIKNVKWWADGSRFEKIIDLTPFVNYQYENNIKDNKSPFDKLETPFEKLYKLPDGLNIDNNIMPDTTDEDIEKEILILSKYNNV